MLDINSPKLAEQRESINLDIEQTGQKSHADRQTERQTDERERERDGGREREVAKERTAIIRIPSKGWRKMMREEKKKKKK